MLRSDQRKAQLRGLIRTNGGVEHKMYALMLDMFINPEKDEDPEVRHYVKAWLDKMIAPPTKKDDESVEAQSEEEVDGFA